MLREYQEEIKRLKEMLKDPNMLKNYLNENSPVKKNKNDLATSSLKSNSGNRNNNIIDEKENYIKEIENDKMRAENAKQEMELHIRKLQEEMIKGGEALKEKDKLIEREKYKLQKQLEEKNKQQQKLIDEQRKKEEEFLTVEQN